MSAVYTYWTGLNHVPFRLLVYMALVSRDRDEEPRYWGGREDLAGALGKRVPREPDDSDQGQRAQEVRRQRKAAFESVRTGLKELKEVGAIQVARTARLGTRAEYSLRLMPQAQPVALAQADPAPPVQAQPAAVTGRAWRQAQTHPGPEEEGGELGTLPGEDDARRSPHVVDLQAPRRAAV